MAKQAGPFYFIGTIDDLVFYKLGDQYYVRRKSDLTVGTIKRLKNSKQHYPVMHMRQQEFGRASKLASQVYRTLPIPKRRHGLHGKLTSKAVKLLRAGVAEAQLLEQLYLHLAVLTAAPVADASGITERKAPVVTLLPAPEVGAPSREVLRGRDTFPKSFSTLDDASLLLNQPTPYLLTKPVNNKVSGDDLDRDFLIGIYSGSFS